MIIDFWKLKEFRYDSFEWPNETSGPLNNDYSIDDYINDVKNIKLLDVKGLVYVQVYHTEKETGNLLIL
jgi:predicted TIM-barrel fold metal-dependent hydrolase